MKTFFDIYEEMKSKHEDVIYLFRAGNYYVAMLDDALQIQLITKDDYLCQQYVNEEEQVCVQVSIEKEELDNVLSLLVRAGKRVAICERNGK